MLSSVKAAACASSEEKQKRVSQSPPVPTLYVFVWARNSLPQNKPASKPSKLCEDATEMDQFRISG